MKKSRRTHLQDAAFAAGTSQFRAEMDCRACQYRVEAALKSLAGVLRFDVSLRRRASHRRFDEAVITASAIKQAVECAGRPLSLRRIASELLRTESQITKSQRQVDLEKTH